MPKRRSLLEQLELFGERIGPPPAKPRRRATKRVAKAPAAANQRLPFDQSER